MVRFEFGENILFFLSYVVNQNYAMLLQNNEKDFAACDKEFPVYFQITAVSQVIFVLGKDFTGLFPEYLFAGWTQDMFGDNFKLTPTTSRASAWTSLQKRCVTSPEKDKLLWENAWDRFSVESFDQLPSKLLKSIRVDDKKADIKRIHNNNLYKRKAVEIFIPKLEKKLELLTGAARSQASEALELLYLWKKQLHTSVAPTAPKRQNFNLKRQPPPPIQLPKPPIHKKVRDGVDPTHGEQNVESKVVSSEDEELNFPTLVKDSLGDDSSSSDSEIHLFIPHADAISD